MIEDRVKFHKSVLTDMPLESVIELYKERGIHIVDPSRAFYTKERDEDIGEATKKVIAPIKKVKEPTILEKLNKKIVSLIKFIIYEQ